MAALCDYSNRVECRANVAFLSTATNSCILCGAVPCAEGSHAMTHHLENPTHVMRAQQYSTCMLALLAHERKHLQRQASSREIVLNYLGDRLACSNVIRGISNYNSTALKYLMRRTSPSELLRVFGEITASEINSARGVCSVCMERPSCAMFVDCKHVCVCTGCAARLRVRTADTEDDHPSCPICRKHSEVVPVYIS